jgi:hypothetical protein
MPPPNPTSMMAMTLPVPYPGANRSKPKVTPEAKSQQGTDEEADGVAESLDQ